MLPNCWPLSFRQWWWSGPSLPRRNRNISAWRRATTIQLGEKRWRLIATCHTSGALARKSWIPQGGHAIPPGDGWWRTPNHNTPETLELTEPTSHPLLGISGLLNLLTWVEHRQLAQASPHEEGGVPCSVPHLTRLPPARFQTSQRSVGESARGQSSAASLAAESPARTPTGAKPSGKQGGRR
jgi:hypothetical protein